MRRYALAAVGRDRPGIVAAVTGVLLRHAVNIEDSQATILRGHFTMMLVVAAPSGLDEDGLRAELDEVRRGLELEALALSELADVDPGADPRPSHIVTLYGADHPGIVHAATSALADRGVDVTGMSTKLAGEGSGAPLYALMMELALPAGADPAELAGALAHVGAEQGVEVSLRQLEDDALQMAVREVLRYPHPVLKSTARELAPHERELAARVARDLLDTMRSFPRCVGIAAPQIDELVRMVVVDVTDHPKATACHGELVLVNPRVVASSGAEVAREGCLSIPDLTANVRRATEVTIAAHDPDGAERRIETEGFEARCLLHELDHLDGLLFLDRVDSLATDVFRRKRYA